jgi:hypothetical protein
MKMKKLFFVAITAVSVLFASCTNDMDETSGATNDNGEGSIVKISLSGGEAPVLRSFFDNTAQAEVWEKTLNSLTIYAYNTANGAFIRRAFTVEELASMSVTFCLPSSSPGDNCEFYAVANLQTEVNSYSALLAMLENSNLYNGTFENVTTGVMRPGGFVMSGKTTKTLSTDGTPTPVSISIRRTVAKFAVETAIAPEFGVKYPGSGIRVNSIKAVRGASTSLVVEQTTPITGVMNYSYTQPSILESGKYGNLFYLFENEDLPSTDRVALEINATYDVDGNFSTASDQYPMTYRVDLGNDAGKIVRNSYYRIQVNIVGLSGDEIRVEIQVADWEGPYNRTENVGV